MIKGPTIFLKTKTSTLSTAALRLIAKETIEYCIATLGVKSSLPIPTVSVIKRGGSRRYGQYSITKNRIQIHHNICGTVQMMIQTLIHEYTHYTQDLKNYDVLYSQFGYDNHPLEVEARKNEKMYSPCWKQIKKNI